MPDRPPPSRFAVIERGGRLVIVDRTTGKTPPSAAERMAEHDRRMGLVAANRPEPVVPAPAAIVPDDPMPMPTPVPARRAASGPAKRPWEGGQRVPAPPLPSPPAPAPARIRERPPPQASGDRKSFTTGKWWDAKGPRTVVLGSAGQADLTGGFMMLVFGLVIAAIVAAFVALPLLFVGGFLLIRFGDRIVAPIGARIIDKALAVRD